MKKRLGKALRLLLPVMLISSLIFAIMPAMPVGAAGWLGTWAKRVLITVNSGDIDSDLTNYPLSIYLSASSGYNSDDVSFIFDELTSDGNRKKIAVTSDDGTTELYVEIEQWDDASEKAWLWVKVPTVTAAANTELYLYYDSAHADNTARVGDTNDVVAENVWDANYMGVWHMRDGASTSAIYDSTDGDHDGSKSAAAEPTLMSAGVFSEAQDFDGIVDTISIADHADLDLSTDLTIELWLTPDLTPANFQITLSKEPGYRGGINATSSVTHASLSFWQPPAWEDFVSTTAFTADVWWYFMGTYDSINMRIFRNGAADGVQAETDAVNTNNNALVFGDYAAGGTYEFDGFMDEVRISNIARSAAYGAANYEAGIDHLLDYGTEELPPDAVPNVTTQAVDDILTTTVTLNGTVVAVNDTVITLRGFVYDLATQGDPGDVAPGASGYANFVSEAGAFGAAVFDYALSGLTEGELYYVRAFALNDDDPVEYGYGAEVLVLTKPEAPTDFVATGGGANEIDLNWTLGAGADKTYIRGEEDMYPDNRADGILIYNDTGVYKEHSGLDNLDDWYYRAWSWATEGGEEQFSDDYVEDWAIASAWNTPTTLTDIISGFDREWAIANGSITTEGDAGVTQVRVQYGLTDGLGTQTTKDAVLTTGDIFWLKIPDLAPGSSYYYRMGAFNGAWGYGDTLRFSTEGSPTIFENVDTDGTIDGDDIYAGNQSAWQVTVLTIAHTLDFANIYVKRTGTPGDAILDLMRADDAFKPTGNVLDTITLDGDDFSTALNWEHFDFPLDRVLEAGELYALVLSAPDGDNANYLEWRLAAVSVLADAVASNSTDSGITWTLEAAGADYLAEYWGEVVLDILDVKVFTNYKEEGDWLVVASAKNYYKPYFPNDIAPSTFVQRFIDDTTQIAQTPLPAWRYRPISFYFSKELADSMEWGSTDYKFRIYGLEGTNPYVDYNIADEDWRGEADEFLDVWVRGLAANISDATGIDLLVDLPAKGEVLNATGSVWFLLGIPDLDEVRPSLFEYVLQQSGWEENTYTDAQQAATDWEVKVGPTVAGWLTAGGGLLSIDGDQVGMMFIVVLMLVIVSLLAMKGHFAMGVMLAFIPLLFGTWAGFVPYVILGVVVGLLGLVMFVWKTYLARG